MSTNVEAECHPARFSFLDSTQRSQLSKNPLRCFQIVHRALEIRLRHRALPGQAGKIALEVLAPLGLEPAGSAGGAEVAAEAVAADGVAGWKCGLHYIARRNGIKFGFFSAALPRPQMRTSSVRTSNASGGSDLIGFS